MGYYYNAMGANNGEYQLHFPVSQYGAPFCFVGVECDEHEIIRINYLPESMRKLPAQNYLAKETAKQLRAYFAKPRNHRFDLPLRRAPTPHQRKVREVLRDVPFGEIIAYKEIARRIKSSARAVGGACRCNLAVLVVPCHRVVAADGIGGFCGGENAIPAKRWLLNHEGVSL
ncbi:MAG: methylated-DNA--[protein]-cysteine S-methyltransferase [Gammaproteobacteria bacterium]